MYEGRKPSNKPCPGATRRRPSVLTGYTELSRFSRNPSMSARVASPPFPSPFFLLLPFATAFLYSAGKSWCRSKSPASPTSQRGSNAFSKRKNSGLAEAPTAKPKQFPLGASSTFGGPKGGGASRGVPATSKGGSRGGPGGGAWAGVAGREERGVSGREATGLDGVSGRKDGSSSAVSAIRPSSLFRDLRISLSSLLARCSSKRSCDKRDIQGHRHKN
mmetsp:Transcript_55543/g.126266  ORF Transcript_55543/g.126266 Transcript_55543/m.126266 type:complete len:218 (-) Transcript_55543:87-740(-)